MRRNKYNVSPPGQRTFKGVVYDSKAEMTRACELDLLHRDGRVVVWSRQPSFHLGDIVYRADFLVSWSDGAICVEEVKGVETRAFKERKRLWQQFGPLPLKILSKPCRIIYPRHWFHVGAAGIEQIDDWLHVGLMRCPSTLSGLQIWRLVRDADGQVISGRTWGLTHGRVQKRMGIAGDFRVVKTRLLVTENLDRDDSLELTQDGVDAVEAAERGTRDDHAD